MSSEPLYAFDDDLHYRTSSKACALHDRPVPFGCSLCNPWRGRFKWAYLEALADAIEDGAYHVDALDVADAMLGGRWTLTDSQARRLLAA